MPGISPRHYAAPVNLPISPDATYQFYLIEEMDLRTGDWKAYLDLARPYVPVFERDYPMELLAGGSRDMPNNRKRVTHLWKMTKGANSLPELMTGLANDDVYGQIDALVGNTRYECQDIAITFGKQHGGPDTPQKGKGPTSEFRYVVGQHKLWTTELSPMGWLFDFDAGYYDFVKNNPSWIHLGNRMKITGGIYDIFELWIAPNDKSNPENILGATPWYWKNRDPSVTVFFPVDYDHNENNRKGK